MTGRPGPRRLCLEPRTRDPQLVNRFRGCSGRTLFIVQLDEASINILGVGGRAGVQACKRTQEQYPGPGL